MSKGILFDSEIEFWLKDIDYRMDKIWNATICYVKDPHLNTKNWKVNSKGIEKDMP